MNPKQNKPGFCESLRVGDRVQVVKQDTVFRNDIATVVAICPEKCKVSLEFIVFDRVTLIELDFDACNQLLGPVATNDSPDRY